MPHPDELIYFGYIFHERAGERVGNARYPGTWLMRRDLA